VTAVGLAGLSVIAIPLQIGSQNGVAADNDGAPDFIFTDSFSVVGGIGSDSQSNMLTSGFGAYIGTGTFDTVIGSVVQNFLSTTGGYGPIQQTAGQTEGLVTVTYEYTAVPEPSTAMLVALGLSALAHDDRSLDSRRPSFGQGAVVLGISPLVHPQPHHEPDLIRDPPGLHLLPIVCGRFVSSA
jgi:hypothetical protein